MLSAVGEESQHPYHLSPSLASMRVLSQWRRQQLRRRMKTETKSSSPPRSASR